MGKTTKATDERKIPLLKSGRIGKAETKPTVSRDEQIRRLRDTRKHYNLISRARTAAIGKVVTKGETVENVQVEQMVIPRAGNEMANAEGIDKVKEKEKKIEEQIDTIPFHASPNALKSIINNVGVSLPLNSRMSTRQSLFASGSLLPEGVSLLDATAAQRSAVVARMSANIFTGVRTVPIQTNNNNTMTASVRKSVRFAEKLESFQSPQLDFSPDLVTNTKSRTRLSLESRYSTPIRRSTTFPDGADLDSSTGDGCVLMVNGETFNLECMADTTRFLGMLSKRATTQLQSALMSRSITASPHSEAGSADMDIEDIEDDNEETDAHILTELRVPSYPVETETTSSANETAEFFKLASGQLDSQDSPTVTVSGWTTRMRRPPDAIPSGQLDSQVSAIPSGQLDSQDSPTVTVSGWTTRMRRPPDAIPLLNSTVVDEIAVPLTNKVPQPPLSPIARPKRLRKRSSIVSDALLTDQEVMLWNERPSQRLAPRSRTRPVDPVARVLELQDSTTFQPIGTPRRSPRHRVESPALVACD